MLPTSLKLPAWALAGTGLAALENEYIGKELSPELKNINLGIGATSGILAANPAHLAKVLGSLPFKQLGLFGIGAMDKLRRQQQSLVDANLAVAKINKSTAAVNKANASNHSAIALAFLLPALAAGGGAAYYAYNQRKKPTKAQDKFETLDAKGNPSGRKKIRIDIPTSEMPEGFLNSLMNVDDAPRAYTRYMSKASAESIPGAAWGLAKELTGIPALHRVGQNMSAAAGARDEPDYEHNFNRYAQGTVGNAAEAAAGIRGVAMPLLAKAITPLRLADWEKHRQANPRFSPSLTKFPTLGRVIDWAQDTTHGARFKYDPTQLQWGNPATKNPTLRWLSGANTTSPKSLWGHAGRLARQGAHKLTVGGARSYNFMRRHPYLSLFGLSLPFSHKGVVEDQEALQNIIKVPITAPKVNNPYTSGTPVLKSIGDMLHSFAGGSKESPVMKEIR